VCNWMVLALLRGVVLCMEHGLSNLPSWQLLGRPACGDAWCSIGSLAQGGGFEHVGDRVVKNSYGFSIGPHKSNNNPPPLPDPGMMLGARVTGSPTGWAVESE